MPCSIFLKGGGGCYISHYLDPLLSGYGSSVQKGPDKRGVTVHILLDVYKRCSPLALKVFIFLFVESFCEWIYLHAVLDHYLQNKHAADHENVNFYILFFLPLQYNVHSYPTTIFYNQSTPHQFHGHHNVHSIIEFLHVSFSLFLSAVRKLEIVSGTCIWLPVIIATKLANCTVDKGSRV